MGKINKKLDLAFWYVGGRNLSTWNSNLTPLLLKSPSEIDWVDFPFSKIASIYRSDKSSRFKLLFTFFIEFESHFFPR